MNKLKRVLTGTLALAMAASMMAACGDSSSSSDGGQGGGGSDSGKTKVKVYTFTNETSDMIKYFLEKNPDIDAKYEYVITMTDKAPDHIQKVESALAGNDAPDLFLADADYATRFALNEKTATLADLGITITESDYYAYTLDFTSDNGTRKALSHQAAPGAVLYRADYAEEYLGLKTPEEVQAAMSDWTKFQETAKTLQEKGIAMISGVDELKRCYMNNRKSAWVTDNKYTIDEATVKEFLETTKALADAGCISIKDKTQWTANWNTGMQEGVFCYFGCTWYLHYTIKPACVTTKTGDKDADGNDTTAEADYYVGNGSFGKWKMIEGPAPYFWGGTWWYGSKQCLDDGTAEAVKAIIEFFCVDDASMEEYMKSTGDFPSKKTVAAKLTADPESSTYKFLDGQDHFTIFREAADHVNVSTCCQYDADFNEILDQVIVDYVTKDVSLDDSIAAIKKKAAETLEGVEGLD